MRKFDFLSGIFLLALSFAICIGSLRLHVGTLTGPGAGFFPLMTGLVLGVFSCLILDRLPYMLETLREMPWVPGPYRPDGLEYVKQLRIRLGLEE